MSNHNTEQASLSGKDTELVPDYIYGVRSWRVREGRLTPAQFIAMYDDGSRKVRLSDLYDQGKPTNPVLDLVGAFDNAWVPGVNTSTCGASRQREYISLNTYITEQEAEEISRISRNSSYSYYRSHGGWYGGQTSEAEALTQEVQRWARDGKRSALVQALSAQVDVRESAWKINDFSLEMDTDLVYSYGDVSPRQFFHHQPPSILLTLVRPRKKCQGNVPADCTCGFYAYNTAEAVSGVATYFQSSTARMVGIIRGSGFATVGARGFRVEKAEIVALALHSIREPRAVDYGVKSRLNQPRFILPALSSRYGVPVFADTAELPVFVDEHLPEQRGLQEALKVWRASGSDVQLD